MAPVDEAPMDEALLMANGASGVATADPAAPPVLTVSVIGGATFDYGGREIGLRNRKARAMLAYVALSETGAEQRERLAGLFWSEFGEQNARATLRQAVHELREAMLAVGCGALVGMRTAVGLRPGSFRVDLNEVLAAVAAREAPEALLREARMAEPLLAGFEDLDPSFHGWLTARRQTLHDRLIRGLEDGYRDAALPRRRRRRLAEAAVLLDPTHEEACRVVMQAAAEDGELGVALRAYDELYRLLGDDYDMEPSAVTQALVAEIKQGKFDAVAGGEEPASAYPALAHPALAHPALAYEAEMRQAQVAERRTVEPREPGSIPSKPALFVDMFTMTGVGKDQAHLVEGFRIELIVCLARFREWYVAGTDGDLTEEHGGVPVSSRYAVTTTAYQGGATINVVMVLHERPSNLAIWGERFELRLDRWFEAQQRIVQRIAATLKVQLSTERLMRLSHMPDASLEAHDIWLRSQLVISSYDAGDWNRTAQMLAQAIEREPGFSPLYSSLSQMNNVVHFVQPGMFRDEHHVQRTLALARRAVALDPRDSRAQLCLGWALAFCRRYSQAELHMEIACELNSGDSWTLMSSAAFHAYNGDTGRALKQVMTSMELTLVPTSTHWQYLTNIRYLHGDHEGTIIAADRAQDGLVTILALRAAALCKLGRTEEARRDVARFYANVRAAWAGDAASTEEAIGRWLLHLYPISRAEVWQRLRDGLALAGIQVTGLTHHG
jgi:DNA-binding SARP family transcriptional activator/TolB-like protein